jgi:hypothetical protein
MESKNQKDENQVTILCSILTYTFEELRIWKYTSLIDQNSGEKVF